MVKINPHFEKLSPSYLFVEIQKRCQKKSFSRPLINLGIGDTVKPLPKVAVRALQSAADEMGGSSSFKGYGPSHGYDFLRDAIAQNDYKDLDPDEIFISHGAKTDCAEIHELFHPDCKVALCDPVYPVYLSSSQLYGRNNTFIPCTAENNFQPIPPEEHFDLIYLCSPNNPTGLVLDTHLMKRWVKYAQKFQSVLLVDGAYFAFIQDHGLPKSIYEIDGAKEVAIEVRSFSKTAGFSGLRCSYTVIPHELKIDGMPLNELWKRRLNITTNGVSYPIQRAAAALYTEEGRVEIQNDIQDYMDTAKKLKEAFSKQGLTVYGGENAPYLWCKNPKDFTSWQFFDFLLEEVQLICTPGVGFGPSGEGYVRFSAFLTKEKLNEVKERIKEVNIS